ncbi:hypothetical protein CSUI_006679 [Cystoisospora suis]|uniref:Uncharacterized protein n=1 Tax=Cystoisospora suis TaxID=483139 RepID=A0A2C6KTN7_9APIC|nr:hypothetical protein CSUI_006679 [Cystoisospora suis]
MNGSITLFSEEESVRKERQRQKKNVFGDLKKFLSKNVMRIPSRSAARRRCTYTSSNFVFFSLFCMHVAEEQLESLQ